MYVFVFMFMLPPALVFVFFFLMIRRPPRSTLDRSSAASDVYKRQGFRRLGGSWKRPGAVTKGEGRFLHGQDGRAGPAVNQPFQWPMPGDLSALRVGYLEDSNTATEDRSDLRVLQGLGVQLVPIRLPDTLPVWAMTVVLNTEAATVFDELNRNNITEGLNTWPNSFRQGAFVSAVEYLRANRLRTMLMKQMQTLMSGIDCYVGGDDLAITNLTGHPTAVLPNGFDQKSDVRTPNAITFTGQLFGETKLLAVASTYQQATGFHREHPTLG